MVAHIPESPTGLEEMIELAPADNKIVSTDFTEEEFRQHGFMQSPYTTRLSFAPLIRKWKKKIDSDDPAEALLAREIMARVEKAPELIEPFDHIDEMAAHQGPSRCCWPAYFLYRCATRNWPKRANPSRLCPSTKRPPWNGVLPKAR
ncbi:MAG: hypothetical protein IPN33_20490 [Saprospiraceae bacterium]|nr:hypothetical protein [Saprospiraceae bacterium]